jgi:hypothetical protein
MKSYDVGDAIRLSAVFYDEDGAPIDPTVITLKVKDLVPATLTYVYGTDAEVIKDRVGHYHADLTITGSGDGYWWFRWTGTGAAVAAEEEKFHVAKKQV